MSLINQVLNRLEQRGVHTALDRTLIRAVPMQTERSWIKPMLGIAAVSVILAVVWLWPRTEQPMVEELHVAGEVVAVPVSAVAIAQPEESGSPASKLSLELSMVPLPESLRAREDTKPATPVTVRPVIAGLSSKSEPAENKLAEIKTAQSVHAENKPSEVNAAPAVASPLKQVSRTQQADAEYRKAMVLQRQRHDIEALAGYEAALKLNEQHAVARLALAAMLMESRRSADAERTLQEGLRLQPSHNGFSMALARVQVERGKIDQALETLQQNLAQAEDKADYQAFYAALLQRQGRHKEAVSHYQIAVRLTPNSGIWLMGYGISLQEVQRIEDARSAY
ncbi:MAG: tetratricopeptide repeat protein, partial [Gallionella sp.]|nr:tetratricopeptide repeat protein [Gallionella sp.]